MSEIIKKIAIDTIANHTTMTFNDLADVLGQKHQFMANRVAVAWRYFARRNDHGATTAIGAAFTDQYGKNCLANKW